MKKKQDVEVFRHAVELATSGDYADWKEIQDKLVATGFHSAPHLLDGSELRAVLDARCRSSRGLRSGASSSA